MRRLTKGFRHFARVASAAALFTAAGFGTAALAQNAASGDVANGKRVYLEDGCFECHGRAGQGGTFNYPAPVLAQLPWPVEAFLAYMRKAPNDMPTYSATVLSDKDATDIYAFLRSLPGRKPPGEFPLLTQ
jgi:mono/diheme cytochrome c family protein